MHPSIENVLIDNNQVIINDMDCQISFSGNDIKIEKKSYDHALGFNKTHKATVLEVGFKQKLETKILMIDKKKTIPNME